MKKVGCGHTHHKEMGVYFSVNNSCMAAQTCPGESPGPGRRLALSGGSDCVLFGLVPSVYEDSLWSNREALLQ
jgi:hypothetical protein